MVLSMSSELHVSSRWKAESKLWGLRGRGLGSVNYESL